MGKISSKEKKMQLKTNKLEKNVLHYLGGVELPLGVIEGVTESLPGVTRTAQLTLHTLVVGGKEGRGVS